MMPDGVFNEPVLPFPEIVDEDVVEWVVDDSTVPNINPKTKRIRLPLNNDLEALAIRAQTLGALKWSPRSYPDTPSFDLIHAVEACRINMLLVEAGIDISLGGISSPLLSSIVSYIISYNDPRPQNDAVRLAVVSLLHLYSTIKNQILVDALPKSVHKKSAPLISTAIRRLTQDLSFNNTLAVASYLESLLGKMPTTTAYLLMAQTSWEGNESRYCVGGFVPWGRMDIDEPLLTEEIPRRRLARTWRALEQGVVFRYPDRYLSDQAVFSYPRRVPLGSLLIDVSGSMGGICHELMAIVDTIPSIVIATYSGSSDRGTLRIVAKSGRRLSKPEISYKTSGSGNIVDGPALQWLAAQPPPRIWVSDGAVTGVGDIPGGGNNLECDRICQRRDIHRIPSLSKAHQALEKHAARMKRRAPLRKSSVTTG